MPKPIIELDLGNIKIQAVQRSRGHAIRVVPAGGRPAASAEDLQRALRSLRRGATRRCQAVRLVFSTAAEALALASGLSR